MRIVYELKHDAIPNVVQNHLFKYTSLQTSFSVNNIALVKGRPVALNLKDMIVHFVEHRHEVVVRRAKFELRKAEERAHVLEGLLIALDNIDQVIKLIRASKTPDEAREGLMANFKLSEIQARAILDMRLQRLTGLERDKIKGEFDELMKTISGLQNLLNTEEIRMALIKEELLIIKEKYGDERRTEIVYGAEDFRIEDMIPNEEVVVTISHLGYIKRTVLTEYRRQSRGGVGSKGTSTRNEDFLEHLFVASTHNYLLIFTEKGKCFWMRVFEIPEGTKASKGRAIQNLLNIEPDDKVLTYINVESLSDAEFLNNHYIVMCTKNGIIKKTPLEQYSRPRANGIIAIGVREGDTLLEARLTNGKNHIIMALKSGKAIHFDETKVRSMGRGASGVKGVTLAGPKDEVIGMICVNDPSESVLVVSEKGYGKRTLVEDYRITNRGGKGVKTLNITDKTGDLISIKIVSDDDDLMIINKSGITIRMSMAELRVMGRATQGVRLINLRGSDSIAAVAKVDALEEDEILLDEEGNPIEPIISEASDETTNDSPDEALEENETEE